MRQNDKNKNDINTICYLQLIHEIMELIVEPDTYTPSIDGQGNYIDVIPPSSKLKHGLYCPCGSRGHKMFTTTSSFSSHTKTKVHQQWLIQLNRNKANFFVESEKLRKTVHQQQKLIAELELESKSKSLTIDYLTRQLTLEKSDPVPSSLNLLDL